MASRRVLALVVAAGVAFGLSARIGAQTPRPSDNLRPIDSSAAEIVSLIEKAVQSRLGDRVPVAVHVVDPTLPAGPFASATPDPMARLGKEIVFTLVPLHPPARPARIRARVEVSIPHLEASVPVLRGHVVSAEDVAVVDGPVVGVPIKRLPVASQVVGQKALRPIDRGQVIESSFVSVRHAVEAGDKVTVMASVGAVTVTAILVAADSGDPGDIIRVVNRQTQRSIRVRVVNTALVEVIDAR